MDVLAFLRHEQPDALVLIDSQLTDIERVKHCLPGWKLLHESRPHDTHKKRPFGGITVLWQSDRVRVCRESGYPKGVLSFAVQDKAERFRPVPFVALYSPPLTSRLNRFGKQWSQDILTFKRDRFPVTTGCHSFCSRASWGLAAQFFLFHIAHNEYNKEPK